MNDHTNDAERMFLCKDADLWSQFFHNMAEAWGMGLHSWQSFACLGVHGLPFGSEADGLPRQWEIMREFYEEMTAGELLMANGCPKTRVFSPGNHRLPCFDPGRNAGDRQCHAGHSLAHRRSPAFLPGSNRGGDGCLGEKKLLFFGHPFAIRSSPHHLFIELPHDFPLSGQAISLRPKGRPILHVAEACKGLPAVQPHPPCLRHVVKELRP